jgi:Ca-activated chloride channel homolog
MNFLKWYLAPYLVVVLIILIIYLIKNRNRAQDLLIRYWGLKLKLKERASFLLYIFAVVVILMALMDLRGPAEKITTKVPQQKTIILIDNSLSMMAEDVRPNRLQKAVLVARHYVQKVVGQNVSILLFSDTHKKLVPFTSDADLLDSRLNSLKDLNITDGGTNLSLAIKESLSYLRTEQGYEGNILILSDAEENEIPVELNIPDSITVAFVGVGTTQGGYIPIKSNNGMILNNKRHQGQEVITKLSEAKISELKKTIKNFKYWIASSYDLPTTDIINFFTSVHTSKHSEKDIFIRPVLGEKLIMLFFLLLFLSTLLKMGNRYKNVVSIFVIFQIMCVSGYANQKEEKQLSKLGQKLFKKIEAGDASGRDKNKMAEEFLKIDLADKAKILYQESVKSLNEMDKVNLATSELKTGELQNAIAQFKKVQGSDNDIDQTIRHNILAAIKQQQQQNQNQDKKDKKGSGGQGGQKQEESEENESDKDNKSDQSKNGQKDQKQEQPKQQKSQLEQLKERKKIQQQLPTLLKQLVQDDRQLQKKLLDTSTNERGSHGPKKDW